MAVLNYKCPKCGAPLKFNPDNQMFSCEYCYSEFTDKYVQDYYAEREQKQSTEEAHDNVINDNAKQQDEDAVLYTCPSCGAEVVTTESTAATQCFYCQNPVVLGGRLSGEFKPNRVVPFKLTKEKAIEAFTALCKKKMFLPKDFGNKSQFEKFQGVYFPYWFIDSQKQASITGKGKKIRTWRSGNKRYTETSIYRVVRGGDLVIKNVFEKALKNESREMLQSVHPFDMTEAVPFSMSYLSGFTAEKRDIDKAEIEQAIEQRIDGYCQQLLKESASEYNSVSVDAYNDVTELESWNYNLLPVWVTSYKYKGDILLYAINGQTGKTYGKLPVAKGKVALCMALVALGIITLGLLGGALLL